MQILFLILKQDITSESVYDFREKNILLFCNMNTYGTRKVTYEKVQVSATVTDCNL